MTYYHDNDDDDAYLLLSIWSVEICVIEHSDGFYPWMIHDESLYSLVFQKQKSMVK